MDLAIVDNGRVARLMEKENIYLKMDHLILEIGSMGRHKVEVYSNIRTETNLKAIGRIIK